MVLVHGSCGNGPGSPTTVRRTILGAHNGYGRGCVMCHAPHSGSLGNGKATLSEPIPRTVCTLCGARTLLPCTAKPSTSAATAPAKYPVTLPAAGTITSAHDANTIILFCLSCHDGVLTKVGMMQGQDR